MVCCFSRYESNDIITNMIIILIIIIIINLVNTGKVSYAILLYRKKYLSVYKQNAN